MGQSAKNACRLLILCAFYLSLCFTADATANQGKIIITINVNNAPRKEVFKQITRKTGLAWFYSNRDIQLPETFTVVAQQKSLDEILTMMFQGTDLDWSYTDDSIVLRKKKKNVNESNNNLLADSTIKAQTVHGRVIGPDANPIIGATILVKNRSVGATTDADGNFHLPNVQPNDVLIIKSMGFETREVPFTNKSILVKLNISISTLDETVILAYGKTTKRFNTGNIGTLKSEDFSKQPITNPLQALQGVIPGLQITQANGLPGGKINVNLQGPNSIGNGNDPFYVVDGVPFISQLPPSTLSNNDQIISTPLGGGSPLNLINPSDIERIDILKDADATAIYGSRAANGAILITTKKGKVGSNKISLDVQQGIMQMTRRMEFMNTTQYLAMRREALKNDGIAAPLPNDYDLTLWDTTRNTDWQKEFLGGTASYAKYTLGTSGGNSYLQYLLSSTYQKQTTVFPGNYEDQKGSVFFNLGSNSEARKFGFNLSGTYLYENNKLPAADLTTQISIAPNIPTLLLPDGSLNWAPNQAGISTFNNPLRITKQLFQAKTTNLISNATIRYEILSKLELKANLGYTSTWTDEFGQGSPFAAIRPERRPNSMRQAYYGDNKVSTWTIEPQVTYSCQIGKGEISALAGTTFSQTSTDGKFFIGNGYSSDFVMADMHSASSLQIDRISYSIYKYSALFGRINYIFNQELVANFTGRRDGSSRFGPENRFHNFGSVGAAWIFTQRSLFKNQKILTFGKIKASYGSSGSDQIGDYSFYNLYNPTTTTYPYQSTNAVVVNNLFNPYLQWEQTKKTQIGLELSLLSDKISITATNIHNRSSNQLVTTPLPTQTGFYTILANFPAIVVNRSWEFTAAVKPINKKNISWTLNSNLTIPKNILKEFPNLESSSYAGLLSIGQPISLTPVSKFLGVDKSTGVYQFADSKGKPTTTPDVRPIFKTTLPQYFGGLQNTISYKSIQLDFSFYFVKQLGQKYTNRVGVPGSFSGGLANQTTELLNRWQKSGDITDVQKFSTSFLNYIPHLNLSGSDFIFEDASFIRLKNVSLSYDLPKSLIKKAHIESIRLYFSAQNLLTITNYSGLDPETRNSLALPPLRNLTIGLSATL